MVDLCEDCILFGRCSGSCGDTDSNYYAEQKQNDDNDYCDSVSNDNYENEEN